MKRSLLCLALTGKTLQENLEILESSRELVDLVEVRADFLDPAERPYLDRFPRFINHKSILTVRRATDGGVFSGSEEERRALLSRAVSGGWSYIDLETDFHDRALEKECGKRGIKVIRSFHDFTGVPRDLVSRVRRVCRGEIAKAAVTPKSTEDLYRLLDACKKTGGKEKIILGMGKFGTVTRILATVLGSRISYCSAPAYQAAPGHLDPAAMYYVYRFPFITRRTKIYGIIGNPVAHSISPRLHNKAFKDLDIDAVYLPFQVDDLGAFMKIASLLGVRGFSVTIPHKGAVIQYLRERDALVDTIGACNTVVKKGRGYTGTNTDVHGFLAPLADYFSAAEMSALKATVVGAGGAARAVVYALRRAGSGVLIVNRTVEKAKMLADEFGCRWAPLGAAGFHEMKDFSDLIVQTTNVGMEPESDRDPLDGFDLSGNELVYDLIYTPRLTRLLERALGAGCKVLNGEEMLVAQAHEQFRLFTGRESTFKSAFLADIAAYDQVSSGPE